MRIVSILLILFALHSIQSVATGQPLSPGYQPDEFVFWTPTAPRYDYGDLALAPERRVAFETQGTPLVHRLRQIEIELDRRGAVEQRILQSNYYVTEAGIQDGGNMVFWVDAFSEQAVIEEAYTLLPDGRRVSVVPETIQLIADTSDDVFSDAYQVVVPFPALDKGALTVLGYRIVQKADAWPLPWSRIYFPHLSVPNEEYVFSLRWDDGGDAPAWRTDFTALQCKESVGSLQCRAQQVPAYPADPNVRYHDVLPQIVVAENTSWQDLAGEVGELFESAVSADPMISETVRDLVGGLDDPQQRVDKLHRFVSQKVRYVGLEHGLGGIVPRSAKTTLERRFGDCKDKTALFVAMAREAGYEAYAVLTSVDRTAPEKLMLPASNYFNHMVGCVRLDDGREFCVDLTDPYSPLQLAAYSMNGAVRLDLLEGEAKPTRFRTPEHTWVVVVSTVNRLHPDGRLTEQQSRTYHGLYASRMRAALKPLDSKARSDWMLSNYQENVSDLVEPDFEVTGLDDVGAPVVIRSKATYRDLFDPETLELYSEQEPWLVYETRTSKTGNQHHAYEFGGIHYLAQTLFHLPPEREVHHKGAGVDFRSRFGNWRRGSRPFEGRLQFNTDLAMPSATVQPDQIEDFNTLMDHIADHADVRFTIRPTSE